MSRSNQNSKSAKGRSASRKKESGLSLQSQQQRSGERQEQKQETLPLRVKLQDGEEAGVGDDVTISGWNSKCEGIIFTIFDIIPYEDCASGYLLKVHVKGDPGKVLKSIGVGFDSTWFRKSV